MATSFYDLGVPVFLQTVRAVRGFLERAVRHCAETGADPDEFVHDMAPFHFQIEAAWHHSVWGLGPRRPACSRRPHCGNGAGGVHPGRSQRLGGQGPGPSDRSAETRIHVGDLHSLLFATYFHFHAVIAYDILRSRGVPSASATSALPQRSLRRGHHPRRSATLPSRRSGHRRRRLRGHRSRHFRLDSEIGR